MGRELQKRKRRSSRPAVRPPNRRKKQLNPQGNNIIAKNWNKNETLSQNYRRLGLVSRLRAPTGGTEPALVQLPDGTTVASNSKSKPGAAAVKGTADDAFPIVDRRKARAGQALAEVAVERDADGKIVRILSGPRGNPLNDPLAALDSEEDEDEEGEGRDHQEEWAGIAEDEDEDESATTAVVKALEREARQPVERRARHQSAREREWLARLVERHGTDTAAMARDARLNPMQQTAADIAKRLKTWRASAAGKGR